MHNTAQQDLTYPSVANVRSDQQVAELSAVDGGHSMTHHLASSHEVQHILGNE